jgi:hypothetical protein
MYTYDDLIGQKGRKRTKGQTTKHFWSKLLITKYLHSNKTKGKL